MANKFKVGDKVIAKKNTPYRITDNGWKGVVTRVNSNGTICVNGNGLFGEIGATVNAEYFDLDIRCNQKTECNQTVVITSDGKTTLARLYQNNSVVKTAKAKCSPDDEFDFEYGANLAYSRLMGLELITAEETASFKKGDRVRITANTNSHNFEIGSVVTIISDKVNSAGQWKCRGIDCNNRIDYWFVKESDMSKVEGLNWIAFKAHKIAVKVTKDNFKKFVIEAKKHGLKFTPDENFNPFESFADTFFRCFVHDKITIKPNEIYIIYDDYSLKVSHFLNDLEEFVW